MKILAVDDDPFILELLPMIAAKAGFRDVTTTSSGELALEAMVSGATAFECLLFDINMPEINGIELCARARQMPAYRRTPIIMLTAMSEKDYMDAAFKAGATDYATKPFDITELGARLRIAQELVDARRGPVAAVATAPSLRSVAANGLICDLSDAIQIDGATDLIDYAALANYLAQRSRAGLAASQVIAVKLDQIEVIHARASGPEFNYALAEVAHAVREGLRTNGYLMAYAGRGIFVIVSNAATVVPAIELETEVQSLLDSRNSEYDGGDPLDITVSIGNPIQPSVGNMGEVTSTFERAIARADERLLKKRSEPRPLNIRVR